MSLDRKTGRRFNTVETLMAAWALAVTLWITSPHPAHAQAVDVLAKVELIIADQGASDAVVVVKPDAGPWEKKAAADLAKYVALMTGARLPVVSSADPSRTNIFVGGSALAADPGSAAALKRVTKSNPIVQADAISVRRSGKHLYVAGSNDESHYFAVSWLLQKWGCRWYMPTEFGESIPERKMLAVGALDFAYSPPFEIRRYWISWNGDSTGAAEFQRRNFMSGATVPGSSHALDQYTSDIAPPGGSPFNVPFADPRTAGHIAAKVETDYASGKDIGLAIADGAYTNDHPADRALGGDYDPYFLKPSLTDAMMTLYNNVSRILRKKHPRSRSKIGGMAYVNVTMPPRKVTSVEPNIVMWIAPIDIDPNHAMDDPRSIPKREYRKMLDQWSKLLPGRLAVYDYDQGMLVWRDLPNPSHHVFARDVKIYRKAAILGFQTESRGAFATTFLNLFFRGQLMWNPDADVPALLEEFYPRFYGPAAVPMARYWTRIFDVWDRTNVTEHEYLAIPAIYTPALVEALRTDLASAEALLEKAGVSGHRKTMFADRLKFTRASFRMIETYVATTLAAARDADYVSAAKSGNDALTAHRSLKGLNPLYVTGQAGGEEGTAWLAGEIRQYAELSALTDGTKGTLVKRLPLEWSFKIEKPVPSGWRYDGPEGPIPAKSQLALEEPAAAKGWRAVLTDRYLQGQGVARQPVGHYWYATSFTLSPGESTHKLRLMFPGLFNEAWLYLNGNLVAHRNYKEPWWLTDYRFEWDIDLGDHARPGLNRISLRGFNPHHFGGMFRRPFVYHPRTASAQEGPASAMPAR